MKSLLIALAIVSAVPAFAADFPLHPEYSITPGSLCSRPNQRRYPEKIAYCVRNVDSQLKKAIIREYDQKFGFRIGQMNRGAFKIDHFIPLCMGGSNDRTNLWPQHKTVYQKTDHLEQELCEQMAEGQLSQSEAVEIIKDAKADPMKLDAYIDEYLY